MTQNAEQVDLDRRVNKQLEILIDTIDKCPHSYRKVAPHPYAPRGEYHWEWMHTGSEKSIPTLTDALCMIEDMQIRLNGFMPSLECRITDLEDRCHKLEQSLSEIVTAAQDCIQEYKDCTAELDEELKRKTL